MVVVDVVNVAVPIFVPCELRPGAILAQGMQALGVIRNKGLDRTLLWSRSPVSCVQPHALIESSEAHMVHTGGGATTTTHGIWSRWRYLGADGLPSPL